MIFKGNRQGPFQRLGSNYFESRSRAKSYFGFGPGGTLRSGTLSLWSTTHT